MEWIEIEEKEYTLENQRSSLDKRAYIEKQKEMDWQLIDNLNSGSIWLIYSLLGNSGKEYDCING